MDQWQGIISLPPKLRTPLDDTILQMLSQHMIDGCLTTIGVRLVTARLFPWLMGETWMWGRMVKREQLQQILDCCLRADLGWEHDGFFRLSSDVQDHICRMLSTHPMGAKVADRWASLMAPLLLAGPWSSKSEMLLKATLRDVEMSIQIEYDRRFGSVHL